MARSKYIYRLVYRGSVASTNLGYYTVKREAFADIDVWLRRDDLSVGLCRECFRVERTLDAEAVWVEVDP